MAYLGTPFTVTDSILIPVIMIYFLEHHLCMVFYAWLLVSCTSLTKFPKLLIVFLVTSIVSVGNDRRLILLEVLSFGSEFFTITVSDEETVLTALEYV